MLKFIAGLTVTVGTLGYITWIFEDILKIPDEDKLKNRSRRAAKNLWNASKNTACQVRSMRQDINAERQKNRQIPDFNRTVLVPSDDPNIEVDSRGRRYAVNGTLFD